MAWFSVFQGEWSGRNTLILQVNMFKDMLIKINKNINYHILVLNMKKGPRSSEFIPLADMHTDGVRFDPGLLLAWKKMRGSYEGDSTDKRFNKIN
jgi:hypothetical protein